MKKYSWIMALLIALSLAFVGCGGGEADPLPPPPLYDANVLQITAIATWGPGLDLLADEFAFKAGDVIEIKGVALTETQILFNNNAFDYQPVGDWDPLLTAGEEFEEELTLVAADVNFSNPKYDAPEALRFKVNKPGMVIIESLIVKRGKKVLFDLADTIADWDLGEVDEDGIAEIDGIQAAGSVPAQVAFEILGPGAE